MSIEIKLLTEEQYKTTSWSGGKTTQLFIFPEEADYNKRDFKFRLSSATVELEESVFTKLEGVYRFITPLDSCLRLTHDGKKIIDLQPFEIYEFAGEKETVSFGQAKDFNLMLKEGAKGTFESIIVEKELHLEEKFGGDFIDFFLFFYVYDEPISVDIHGQVYNLIKGQSLLIKSDIECAFSIKLESKAKTRVLAAKIRVK